MAPAGAILFLSYRLKRLLQRISQLLPRFTATLTSSAPNHAKTFIINITLENKMRLATQQIVRIAAILALTAASTSAFAQSAEFRRGYDEGFAAGQRAAHGGPGGRPGWDRVRVEEAEYGVRGA